MKKLLFTTLSLFFLFSCSSNNSDDENNKNEKNTISYYFIIGSVRDSDNDEEKKYEIEIDGEKFNGTAPNKFKKTKHKKSNESHIKFKLNSSLKTNVVYELRSGGFGIDSKYLAGGTFQDQLDTIIIINKN